MARRTGWLILAVVAGLFLLGTAAGTAIALFVSVRDGKPGDVFRVAGYGVAVSLFWVWIALGARNRLHQTVDETGQQRSPYPVGPWGWVGRFLIVALVAGFVVVGIWAGRTGRNRSTTAEQVRRDANRVARQADLTITKVRTAKIAFEDWTQALDGPGDAGPNPLDVLLPVPNAEMQDAVVEPGHAALLVRPSQGPPCVVVDIDNDNLVSTRTTQRC